MSERRRRKKRGGGAGGATAGGRQPGPTTGGSEAAAHGRQLRRETAESGRRPLEGAERPLSAAALMLDLPPKVDPVIIKGSRSKISHGLVEGSRLARRFKLLVKVSGGTFGDVFIGRDIKTRYPVCIKVEKKLHRKSSTLRKEMRIYRNLREAVGLPTVFWWGQHEGTNVMVMDVLGPSLKQLLPMRTSGRFSPLFTAKTMIHAMRSLRFLHARGYLHQDVKPHNMVLAPGTVGVTVYMCDLGIARRFRDRETDAHLPIVYDQRLVGTVNYATINNHLGIEMSRRDDLECLAYVAVFMLFGSVPWAGLKKLKGSSRREQWANVQEVKQNLTPNQLFGSSPDAFATFLTRVLALEYDETPNYHYLMGLFKSYIRDECEKAGRQYTDEILEDEMPDETYAQFHNWRYDGYLAGREESDTEEDEGTYSSSESSTALSSGGRARTSLDTYADTESDD